MIPTKWRRRLGGRNDQENENSKEGEEMSKSIAPALPFDCMVGETAETITNPYSKESVELSPEAVAVYDTIKGAEMLGNYDHMEKGIAWFQKYYPKEYMILLD
jgi:hypothetical protein